jgi:hypothetical protein
LFGERVREEEEQVPEAKWHPSLLAFLKFARAQLFGMAGFATI